MNDGAESSLDILPLLDRLRAIAQTGLTYASNPYDHERYDEMLELVATHYGKALDAPAPAMRERLAAELGFVTPKVGADAAIFDASGRALLMLRADNHKWCMPCGLSDSDEHPAETAVREAQEETGLDVRVVELVEVFFRPPMAEYTPYALVSVVYLCEITGGTLQGSHEDAGLEWWDLDAVPVWHGYQERQARAARERWRLRRRL